MMLFYPKPLLGLCMFSFAMSTKAVSGQQCMVTDDCATRQVCVKHVCYSLCVVSVPTPAEASDLQCTISDDCTMLQVCVDHVCKPAIEVGITFLCTLFLIVSELLPFLTSVRANGIIQALLLAYTRRKDHGLITPRGYGAMDASSA